ncbi:AbrB family transcriptional regulator [Neisseria montereyensis]|uniref:AbrB family transcriptional regulator n=1 Tax=Neisseria montereyensis TaxID=2973938 RepID=A0ABT2FE20_9NEIS|nr:AbrB family transcriptional regulator [Neisseria montereyensis]MCS4534469.1 AbrB family transcriptional regulator [Neisseria montereyensis]
MAPIKYLSGFMIALGGAWLADVTHIPIPWLLGPLLATAVFGLNGVPVRAPAWSTKVGLMVIGLSLGLYFTPQMAAILLTYWPLMIFGMLFSLSLGILGSVFMYRRAKVDFATAWYASAMGGASQMAYMAVEKGADIAKVVSAHSLRVLMIVTIVPFFYQYMGFHNTDSGNLAYNTSVHWVGLLGLFACGYVCARLFERLRWTNAWTFGPLAAATLLTLCNIHFSAIPSSISHISQIFIGWSLGNKFVPGFFRSAPRLLAVVAVNVAVSLLLTALATYLLANTVAVSLPTLGLGLAPGGVTEMTITAKTLQLGVPLVTAFHVSRMLVVIGTADVLHHFFARFIVK